MSREWQFCTFFIPLELRKGHKEDYSEVTRHRIVNKIRAPSRAVPEVWKKGFLLACVLTYTYKNNGQGLLKAKISLLVKMTGRTEL